MPVALNDTSQVLQCCAVILSVHRSTPRKEVKRKALSVQEDPQTTMILYHM